VNCQSAADTKENNCDSSNNAAALILDLDIVSRFLVFLSVRGYVMMRSLAENQSTKGNSESAGLAFVPQ